MTLPGMEADRSRDVITSLNYYDDPGDGSKPEPVYVKKYLYLWHSLRSGRLILANQALKSQTERLSRTKDL